MRGPGAATEVTRLFPPRERLPLLDRLRRRCLGDPLQHLVEGFLTLVGAKPARGILSGASVRTASRARQGKA
jgi:hypothetical protein